MDELKELRDELSMLTSPIARHLTLCDSLRRIPGTKGGLTCDHDFWWGLTATEQHYMSNKI
jgi:hypothetical protein